MSHNDHLDITHAQLLVVDIQARLLPHVGERTRVVLQAVRMIRAAREMELPITVSEQYPQGLGASDPRIVEAASDAARIEKVAFSVCGEPEARERIVSLLRPQVLLVGIETHVCIQQTAFDLLGEQMRPIVLADAVGSRRVSDHEIALQRMRAAGITVTSVESAIYELMGRSGTELFKRILPLVR